MVSENTVVTVSDDFSFDFSACAHNEYSYF